jgi:alpha-glucosidase
VIVSVPTTVPTTVPGAVANATPPLPTWSIDPAGEAPELGRDRTACTGFACPPPQWHARQLRLSGATLCCTLQRQPLALRFTHAASGATVLADRPTGAYLPLPDGPGLRHYQHRNTGDRHLGLGDKTGGLDHTGRRLRCQQLDALGYDAERADPLYKHAPFLIVDSTAGGSDRAVGLLYDTLADVDFDLGAEHSNYHAPYRYAEVREGTLVYYVLDGPRLSDLVPRLHALVGRPPLPPRWALGFGFTAMAHADAPDAQQRITAFARRARQLRLPISSIHFGSGYSSGADGRRYVFTWNRSSFPDRDALFATLRSLGYRTVANVKPVLLTTHPDHEALARDGLFLTGADGRPALTAFWGGQGAVLDFTNRAAARWWRERLTRDVLDAGFDGVWNDNNEGEIEDWAAQANGFGTPRQAFRLRPLQALLMTRASRAAQWAARPGERPYTISRAGPLGIGALAETWTGDNATSWHTLRWNLFTGLSMSLSGMPLVGHDIGGFTGPAPDAELLVRWFQMLALHPRAVMNSWNTDGSGATTPWRHESALDAVRAALALRYRLLPYLYTCCWHAHRTGVPVLRPLEYLDPACRGDGTPAYLLGDAVLVLPVCEPGVRRVRCRLPGGHGWVDPQTQRHHGGGAVVELDAPLERLCWLVAEGQLLPLAEAWPDDAPHDATAVSLNLWLPAEAPAAGAPAASGTLFFDDGLSDRQAAGDASFLAWRLDGAAEGFRLRLRETGTGRGRPPLRLRLQGPAPVPLAVDDGGLLEPV